MCKQAEKTQDSQRMSEEYEPGLVSVIIPTYNRADLVREAIQSVLEQTYQNFELIVVDDGSTDNTEEVVNDFKDSRIRYIRYKENRGGSAARNTGIKSARGKYIAFHDSDDLWLPEKLHKQVDILEKNPEIALVCTNIIYIDKNGKHIKEGFKPKHFTSGYGLKEILLGKAPCLLATWLVRKSCFDKLGYFDESFEMAQGREMLVRIAREYNIAGIKEPLYLNRNHDLPRTSRKSAKESEYFWLKFIDKTFRESGALIDEKTKRMVISRYSFSIGIRYLKEMNCSLARKKMWSSIVGYPFRLIVYKYFFSTLFGKRGLRIIKLYKSSFFYE